MAVNDKLNGQDEQAEQPTQEKKGKKKEISFVGILIMVAFLVGLLSIPLVFTKFNILGAGEMLRPILKTSSVFRNFLPTVKDPNDAAFMNREQLLALINDQKGKVTSLETQLKESERVSEIYTGSVDGFQKFDADKAGVQSLKQQIDSERAQLEKDKVSFYEMVKNQDKPSFKEFYERMDAATAQKIYNSVMNEDKVSEKIKAFVDYYQKMDATACAKIFEQLAKTEIETVAEILKNMDTGKASKVLEAMDTKVAGRITEILAKKLPIPKS